MKIAITSPSFSQNKYLVDKLKQSINAEFLINEEGKRFADNELLAYLNDCDAAIVGLENLSKDILIKLPKLKYISKYGVGLDNIDLDYCNEMNIKIGWTGGVNKLSVAEMVLGFMLSLCRNLYSTNLLIRKGEWKKNGGFQLSGKKIGIIGFGNIGKEVARLLKPFDCEIYVHDVLNKNEEIKSMNCIPSSLNEIISTCEVITLHIPHNDENHYLINEKLLSHATKQPILINTSRGGIVDESCIVKSLNEGVISYYASDVFEIEPSTNSELLNHTKVFATPHIGGNSKEAVILMGESAINNLKAIINEI